MKISICIPTWEQYGVGVSMLKRCLDSIQRQTFRDFEIIVSDNSQNDEIRQFCEMFGKIRYIYNPVRGMATNTNNAISKARGELIKILYQDDWLVDEDALEDIVDNFQEEDIWMITACSNNKKPHYQENANTLGSPSVLTIRNKDILLFNSNLKWMLDLEYYNRMFWKYGNPKILNKIGVIIGIHDHQETNHLTQEEKQKDYESFIRSSSF